MTKKTTPHGRRLARLSAAGTSRKRDGITMAKMLNTRLTADEINRIMGPCRAALQALREARATYSQWVVLCTASHVATAIEDGGVIRGQRGIFTAAEAALDSIGERCGHTAQAWRPSACHGHELTALADLVAAHSRQVHELTYSEYARAADLAKARVASSGGKVFKMEEETQ